MVAATSLKKLRDYTIVDHIERNARDPIRKLGPDDRLVGSARLALKYGMAPVHLATAIAAAIYYDEPSDPAAQELVALRRSAGIDGVLSAVCSIDISGELAGLVRRQAGELAAKGWLKQT